MEPKLFEGRTFGPGELVEIDGNHFKNCTFKTGSRMVFRGIAQPVFDNLVMEPGTGMDFQEHANITIQTLRAMCSGGTSNSIVNDIVEFLTGGRRTS